MTEDIERKIELFLRIYSNLDVNERKNVIVVIDNQPYSWEVAYIEISNKTELGKKILEKLVELEII